MQRKLRTICMLLSAVLCLLYPSQSVAQNTPAAANMASLIAGLQTGQMNWNRFYPQVKQVIAQQTGGTGRYIQLAQLGPILNVVELAEWRLPNGFFYYYRSFFNSGAVDWQVASDMQGNILGISFGAATQDNIPTTGTKPASTKPAKPADIDDGGTDAESPKTKGEACSKFPGLC